MAWTDEMVEDLRRMWVEGLTAKEIATRLGVSKNSIVGKVHRLCLTARPSPIKRKDVAEEVAAPAAEVAVAVEEITVVEEIDTAPQKKAQPLAGTNIKLVDLDSHTCRWPIGDPRDDDFCFCGKKVHTGQTYCDEHAVLAYVKPVKK